MSKRSASAGGFVAVMVAVFLSSLPIRGSAASEFEPFNKPPVVDNSATGKRPNRALSKAAGPRTRDGRSTSIAGGAYLARRSSLVGNHVAPAGKGRWQWTVTKQEWTAADEEAYGAFLLRIGESNCKTTHECLTSPDSNPAYHATNPPGMTFFADCADLPFVLRAYFAWKNGLPFSFSTAMAIHPKTGSDRPGSYAFKVAGRYHVVPPSADPRQTLTEILRVSTAHFRVPLAYKGQMLPDHYPVEISRESVKAGTVIFDTLGHVNIVYKVTEDGLIHYIDANPDNALTRGVFGSDVERAGPDSGAGFLRWRPQSLVGASKGRDGRLHGGTLVLARNEQLPDWSDTQYFGTGEGRSSEWQQARFFLDGEELDYYAYVRLRLAPPGYRFNPVAEVRQRVRTLCDELHQRVDAVNAAVRAGIPRRPQPQRLPQNIYVTQGDWEAYATPSRDARLKVLFVGLREDVKRFISMHAAGGKHLDYRGANLREDLNAAYASEAEACNITYTRSDGSPQSLSFNAARQRLFLMSFDPHHCVERRWGASSPDELKTCQDDALKQDWYNAQQRLRNQTVRTVGDRMNFTLEDLRRQARESSDEVGEDEPPVIEVSTLLVPD